MTGLVGWWPLHENSGSAARDLSGNGNHGTLNGGVTQGVAGKGSLTAYSFDGSDDYVSLPSFSVSEWTLAAWCKFESSSGNHEAAVGLGSTDGSSSESRVQLKSHEIETYVDGSSHFAEFSEKLNNWVHLVILQDGNGFSYYLNGENYDSSNLTVGIDEFENIDIGRTKFTDNVGTKSGYQEGLVSDVRLYNRALSPQEIQTLYKWGSGDYTDSGYHDGSDSGAVSRWKFDNDNSDTSVAEDFWGSNSGTINGATYKNDSIRSGESLEFNGSDNYVEFSSISFETGGSATFSCWWKTTDIDDKQPLFYLKGADEFSFFIDNSSSGYTSNTLDFATEDERLTITDERADDGNWHHAVVIYDDQASEMIIYVNGVREGKKSVTASMSSFDEGYFGRISTSASYPKWYGGKIDDARFYNRALEPHEVFQLYQWGTRGRDMRKLTVNSR